MTRETTYYDGMQKILVLRVCNELSDEIPRSVVGALTPEKLG
jgi:hypothetical protein